MNKTIQAFKFWLFGNKGKCPKCGKELTIKDFPQTYFYIGCTNLKCVNFFGIKDYGDY